MLYLIHLAAATAAPLASSIFDVQPSPRDTLAGDTYEITLVRESSQEGTDGSSGTTYDKDTLTERVIGVRADGLELEYDLPTATPADARAKQWKFPVRVFKPHTGPMQLLNSDELEARVDRWLKQAEWPRSVCGRWIFTWNAFRIECDPSLAVKTVEAFDLGTADIRERATYRDSDALQPATLTRDGRTLLVTMQVNPDVVRRARAESDVATGEILRKPVTMEAALRKRSEESISGTISVTFDLDSAGKAYRRTKVTTTRTTKPDGRSDTEVISQTLERRSVPRL